MRKRGHHMVKLFDQGSYLIHDTVLVETAGEANLQAINDQLNQAGKPAITPSDLNPEAARENTLSYGIFKSHNTSGDMKDLRMKFDSMASHDITFVGNF